MSALVESLSGHTPLFAAISGRQWETAKLVVAIAIAQYKPPKNTNKFSTKDVRLYADEASDDGSSASNDSDATASPQDDVKFIDITKRPSPVESEVHPKRMLDTVKFTWYTQSANETYMQNGNLLLKTIHDNDLEAFVNVFNLYISTPVAIPMENAIIDAIVSKDRAEMLDAYIHKTGQGVEIKANHDDPSAIATNDKTRSKRSDPGAIPSTTSYPLVWMAAQHSAKLIIEYLAGDRPLAAFRHYMYMGGDERAYQMRRIKDIEKVLHEWLGWTITELGDSPLMAAIIGRDFDLLKFMLNKKPSFMISCLNEPIKFSGYNVILLAAHMDCRPEVLDYLLERTASPVVKDTVRGCLNPSNVSWLPHRVDLNGLEQELKRLRNTVEQFLQHGTLAKGDRLTVELVRFMELMEEKVAHEKTIENVMSVATEEPLQDTYDSECTLKFVATAVAASPGMRQLVHLIDVQKSVQSGLLRYSSAEKPKEAPDNGEGLKFEVNKEIKEHQRSFVMTYISDFLQPDHH
ncbi:hypothetical protein H0H87_002810 [Tephrocybe sp. NHM501043]|nr:hypothetical protein H0H87_002810 [Tephrocybe sp. NHM501043]